MRITRVYTRSGDKGQTSLIGEDRVPKDDPRLDAYGTLDELNAIVGIVRAFIEPEPKQMQRIDRVLKTIQNQLFDLGTDVATPAAHRWEGMERVGQADVDRLERWCDEFNAELEPLEEFVLPGGGKVGAFLHQARTVCRRAERDLLRFMRHDPEASVDGLTYLNRLSDLFFILGRWAAMTLREPEVLWEREDGP